MKQNIYALYQEKKSVKVKHRGLASLATSSMSNNKKLAGVNNKYVWPSAFCAPTKNTIISKKTWPL